MLDEEVTTNDTEIEINTPFGRVSFDARAANKAWKKANKPEPRPPTRSQSLIESYIGGVDGKIAKWWGPRWGELLLTTLDAFLEEEQFTIDRLTHFTPRGTREQQPEYRIVKTGCDSTVDVTIGATRLVRSCESEEIRFALINSIDCDNDIRLSIHFNPDIQGSKALASKLLSRFEEYFYEHGPLRDSVWDADFNFLPRYSGASEKLILPSDAKAKVERHLTGFISVLDHCEERGISSNRGIILSGPPGTGKTLLIKSIIEQTALTTILVTPDMIALKTINRLYRIARKLRPVLIIFEDIDSAGGLHRKISSHPVLGEILQALDGVENNAGVITIASTNYLENIDDALRDRPGRFERIISIPIPDTETRTRLIVRLSDEFGIGEWLDPERLSAQTDGFTGDWLRNLFTTSSLISLQDGRDSIERKDIDDALMDINDNRRLAYIATPELKPPSCLAVSEAYA